MSRVNVTDEDIAEILVDAEKPTENLSAEELVDRALGCR